MNKISRKEAKLLGLNRYFTGEQCIRGGIAERKMNGDCLCSFCKNKRNSMFSEWRKNNIESFSKMRKINYKKNKEVVLKRNADWKKKNNQKVNVLNANRVALKNNAVPSWYGEFDDLIISEAYDLAKLREISTGIKWEVDHMIPLNAVEACGLHCGMNIQVIPAKLNSSKRNEMQLTEPYQWI